MFRRQRESIDNSDKLWTVVSQFNFGFITPDNFTPLIFSPMLVIQCPLVTLRYLSLSQEGLTFWTLSVTADGIQPSLYCSQANTITSRAQFLNVFCRHAGVVPTNDAHATKISASQLLILTTAVLILQIDVPGFTMFFQNNAHTSFAHANNLCDFSHCHACVF